MAMNTTQRKAVKDIVKQYKHPFDVEMDAIDLRAMSKNFNNGIIPNVAVDELINAILDNAKHAKKHTASRTIDPTTIQQIPKFEWVNIDDTAINPIFQRDVAPNHVSKIEKDFDPHKIIVPCAIKDVNTGLFLLWDGHHTTRVCSRQGWEKIPVWYIEADTNLHDSQTAMDELVLLAGRAFLTINKTNKRSVSRLDEHLISYECHDPDAVKIQSIVSSTGCNVARLGRKAGDISHISNLYDTYNLQTSSGMKGVYLRRSLEWHRATWPNESVQGVMMRSYASMLHSIDIEKGGMPDSEFDIEMTDTMRDVYGPSAIAYEEINEKYEEAYGDAGRDSIPARVTAGMMCHYVKHVSRYDIGSPEFTFMVD
jgi:hypothetical protein